jgi:hypothetical protein
VSEVVNGRVVALQQLHALVHQVHAARTSEHVGRLLQIRA